MILTDQLRARPLRDRPPAAATESDASQHRSMLAVSQERTVVPRDRAHHLDV